MDVFGNARRTALDNILLAAMEFDIYQVIKESRYVSRIEVGNKGKLLCSNSRCCCKETPSTTGCNVDIFHLHYTGTSKVVFLSATYAFLTSVHCVKHAYYSKRARVCCANWIALRVEGLY